MWLSYWNLPLVVMMTMVTIQFNSFVLDVKSFDKHFDIRLCTHSHSHFPQYILSTKLTIMWWRWSWWLRLVLWWWFWFIMIIIKHYTDAYFNEELDCGCRYGHKILFQIQMVPCQWRTVPSMSSLFGMTGGSAKDFSTLTQNR